MARKIDSKILFLTTSPRTPDRMTPEIDLLIKHFSGQPWNKSTQTEFMKVLASEQFFNGKGENDPAFSARDRINRAPKSLGFVVLSPKIAITPAGEALLSSKRKEEVFLRQLLKFQVPSPYHKPTEKAAAFCVKPYLEMLRLVRRFGMLSFDELQIFGMQLTDWHDFESIVKKINTFRKDKDAHAGAYKKFKAECLEQELRHIYKDRIETGETHTRESDNETLDKFLRTQSNNMRDYADACLRYLNATGLVRVSHIGRSLSIVDERIEDVDYILNTVDRNPCVVDDEDTYVSYLGDASVPRLLTDDRQKLIAKIKSSFPDTDFDANADINVLKDVYATLLEARKINAIYEQVAQIKDCKFYDDIQSTYSKIIGNELYDAPLMFEWNTWRAMTMLDGGDIRANLKFDDFGRPMSLAHGNMADIVCDYKDFMVSVEVTLASGQRQYEMEGEPISRHLGRLKEISGRPCYCLFVAPRINEACVAHFYALHNLNLLRRKIHYCAIAVECISDHAAEEPNGGICA